MNRRNHMYDIGETLVYTGNREYSQKNLIGKLCVVEHFDWSISSTSPMYKVKFFHFDYTSSLLPLMLHAVFEGNVARQETTWEI